MSISRTWKQLLAATFVLSMTPGQALAGRDLDRGREKEEEADKDDANGRRQAMDEWYNESYGKPSAAKSRRGGPWSASFQKFMNEAAAKERAKNGSLLPGISTAIVPVKNAMAPTVATGTTWVNIGPVKANYAQNGGTTLNKTDAGRANTILVDPTNASILYVAFSGGGVWKSTDGGTTWVPKTETLGSLSVGSLAMDPTNSSVLYLGLGDAFDGTGIGLVKSTDGGNTWFNPVYLGASTSITDIRVTPGNSNIVLATTNKGLFRSVDAGATFSAISLSTGFTEAPAAWSLAWAGGNQFVASLEAEPSATSGNTQGQLWVTADNGATWARATGVTLTGGLERMTVASAPSLRTTLYAMAANPAGDLAEVFKSTNGGTSWTALGAAAKRYKNGNTEARTFGQLLNTQGWYNQLVLVDPANANTVYFGGALHLAKTADGGSTFSQVSNWLGQFSLPYVHADFHSGAIAGGKIYVGSDGGLFVSSDGGTTWSDALNVGISAHLVYDIGSSAGNRNAVIAGLQDNGTRVRVTNSTIFNQEIGGDGFGCDINRSNASLMLGSLYYARIYKSTDAGLNFTLASTGITESNNSSTAPFITRLTAWDGDATGNTLFTYANLKVYKTVNYAGTWTALGTTGLPATSFVIRNVGVAKSNVNVVGVVASGGRVFLTNNGGTSWTQTAALPNNGLSISSVTFDTVNPNIVYVGSVAPDGTKSHLWKSVDFGASWTVIEAGLPAGVPVNTVVVDPTGNTTLYAATHLGVYRSTDSGATWVRFGAGLPLVNVTDIQILPDSSLVRAGTFGRSVWELVP